jgi:hypothetical protein
MFGQGGFSLGGAGGAVGAANKEKIAEVKGWIKEAGRGKRRGRGRGEPLFAFAWVSFLAPSFIRVTPIVSWTPVSLSRSRSLSIYLCVRVCVCCGSV